MKFYEFGIENTRSIMLIPGTKCHWKNNFGHVSPILEKDYGIRVTMYYDDHNPPHFHAEDNGYKAIVRIDEASVIKGVLPSRQLKLILAWCVLHQDELMQNWELAKDGKPLNRIIPSMYISKMEKLYIMICQRSDCVIVCGCRGRGNF